jgi:hypothetical protein
VRAAADVVVDRASLADPAERQRIRLRLYGALDRLGRVEHITRYVRDPKDGPYADSQWGRLDRDRFAVVRVEGIVSPRTLDSEGAETVQ